MPALPQYIIEPIWGQFSALLPEREVNHPLGCHRPRIPDRVIFEKLIQVLVLGCAYHRIADESCSATTLRDRRSEEHTSELQSRQYLVCRLLLEKQNTRHNKLQRAIYS